MERIAIDVLHRHTRVWEDRIYRPVCDQRTWITQERWLSLRMLHFLFDQLVWECRELEASEAFPHGLPRETKLSTYTEFKQNSDKVLSGEGIKNSERLRHQDWCKVLATCSRSDATFDKDRLIAIKEVAKTFLKILDDEWKVGKRRRTSKSALSLTWLRQLW
jgi:hypothetical protein